MGDQEKKDPEKIVLDCVLFRGISPERGRTLLQFMVEHMGAEQKSFQKGERIYSPEDYRKSLGILFQGTAAVEKNGGLLLNILHEGDCFGVAALFAESEQYVSTVRAKTNCAVLFLPAESVKWLFAEEPQISVNYITFLSERVQFLNRKIDRFTAPSAEQTLLGYLQEQAPAGGAFQLAVPMAKLADILNISRSSLYRALEELEQQGAVLKKGKTVLLLSPNPKRQAEETNRKTKGDR